MPVVTPPTVGALPLPPDPNDRATFNTRAYPWSAALPAFGTDLVAVANNVANNATDALTSATVALGAASAATATVWVSGSTYAVGDARYSPITFATYRRRTAGAGVTDPSTDGTNWALVQGHSLQVSTVAATTQLAVAGTHYVLTNIAATTLTLPATPASGDTVWVTVVNGLATNIIARNGKTIMGLAEDMTIDSVNVTVQLRFIENSWRIT